MNTLRRVFCIAALAVAVTSVVGATTITGQIGPTASGYHATLVAMSSDGITDPNNPTQGSQTVNLNQFNATSVNADIQAACPTNHTCSTLTLTEIDFTLGGTVNGTLNFYNNSTDTSYDIPAGTATGDLRMNVGDINSDPNAYTVAEAFPGAATTGFTLAPLTGQSVNGTSGTQTLNGKILNAYDAVNGGYPATTDSGNLTFLADLSTYLGSGTIPFTVTLDAVYNVPTINADVSPILVSSSLSTGSATILYKYTYDDSVNPPSSAPEPATMALFGSALLGIGLLRKRSTRQ